MGRFEGEITLSICNLLESLRTKKLSTTKMKLYFCSVWFIHNSLCGIISNTVIPSQSWSVSTEKGQIVYLTARYCMSYQNTEKYGEVPDFLLNKTVSTSKSENAMKVLFEKCEMLKEQYVI